MSFLALPNELLLLIAKNQDSQHDKNALARTNHRCYALLNSPLYAYNAKYDASSALHWGASYGLFRTTQESLRQGADIESEGADVQSEDTQLYRPLALAILSDHTDIATLLMDHGADPYAKRNNLAAVKAFLARGVDPNHRDCDSDTPLHIREFYSSTPLHFTAAAVPRDGDSHEAMARALIEAGADLESTHSCRTPLQVACRSTSSPIGLVRCLIENGADCHRREERGKSSLHLASQANRLDIIRLLLDTGADIEARDRYRCTPLHWACWYGNVEAAEALLDAGADIEARSRVGNTPLILGVHGWVRSDTISMTTLLLKRGADTNAVNMSKVSALHCALIAPDGRLCEMLLSHGADPEARTLRGKTPLHKALQFNSYCSTGNPDSSTGSLEQVKLLLKRGVDVEAKDEVGDTPLHEAARGADPTIFELLLEAGANYLVKNKHGKSPAQLRSVCSEAVKTERMLYDWTSPTMSRSGSLWEG
ncbi:ATPase inhibitor IATP mitochondria [Penicillium sp. DV-2018c]|nr:ATPase inhibitor IATP mitochondria [Penicillium sp. DV-2018c]KAJ5581872.1 ATPase inhibitor IATP mitochondria [Penicillium sp. DV-2018c]